MKKFWIVFLFMFGLIIDVSATEIIVDDVSYDADSDFYGEGFTYDGDTHRLYLDGYHGGSISCDNSIAISIKNTNIIDGQGASFGIKTKDLVISGEGILNIVNVDIGIYGEMVYLDKITAFIMSKDIGINIYSSDGCLIKKSQVVIENSEIGISSVGGLTTQYSTLNVINSKFGIQGHNSKLNISSSEWYIKTDNNCVEGIQAIDISESQIVLKSNAISIVNQHLIKKETNMFYVSNDDINYIVNDYYWNYSYLKLGTIDKIDDLLISDEGLIFEIDKSFLIKDEDKEDKDEEILDVVTESEYTESEFGKEEIINPETVDNIYMFLMIGGISLIFIISIFMLRRKYG